MTDDLISRQEAIDVLGVFTQADALGHTPKQIVEALPSAQSEIIRCKDCKYMTEHYDTDGNVPYWTCSEWDSGTDYDGFCFMAKRRTDDKR